MKYPLNKVAIIGVGLMGGSLGLALKKRRLAQRIVGFGRTRSNLNVALKKGLIDSIAAGLKEAVSDADMVILAGPVSTIKKQLSQIAPFVKKGALVMDLGSTKAEILKEARKKLPATVSFVGAHPLTGTENSGARAATKDLYKNKICFLVGGETDQRAAGFWKRVGSHPILISAEKHDRILAQTSHLPQIVSSLLMVKVGALLSSRELKKFSGGGLRDTTRLASSPAQMWVDILMTNRQNIAQSLDGFLQEGCKLAQALSKGDRSKLLQFFFKSNQARQKLVS